MKALAYILVIIMIALNMIPCSDTICNHNNEQAFVQCSVSAENTDISSVQHVDMCSPFCSCNCTQTAKNFPIIITIKEEIQPTIFLYSKEYEQLKDSYLAELYRPPIV